jgi:hypothetical protein
MEERLRMEGGGDPEKKIVEKVHARGESRKRCRHPVMQVPRCNFTLPFLHTDTISVLVLFFFSPDSLALSPLFQRNLLFNIFLPYQLQWHIVVTTIHKISENDL